MRRFSLPRFFALTAASAALVGILGCNLPDAPLTNLAGVPAADAEPGAARPSTWGANAVARAISAQGLHGSRLMAIKGVIGAGASVAADESPVVVVFAEQAGVAGIPAELDGVPVVVEVVGKVEALQTKGKNAPAPATPACVAPDRAGRFARPVPIGVSTGHASVTAGTIGVRVKDSKGKLFLLSNNHVFANVNKARTGDNILQPGPFDGGTNPADAIGTLGAFQAIAFCTSSTACPANAMDAALAATTATKAGNATPCDGYGTPSKTPYPVMIPNLAVKKYGRTTGLTKGVISAVNVTINVGYAGGTAQFTGQVYLATPNFNGPGDSGSLIVSDAGNQPVALLFAGTSTATFATPIAPILSRFGVTVDGI